MPDPLDVYGKAELIHALGVSRQRVAELQATDPGFPKPAVVLTCGPIWHGETVRAYAVEYAKHKRRDAGVPRPRANTPSPQEVERMDMWSNDIDARG